ncbi:MAG TPA: TIM barrel protein [Acidobacteriaceae bacterium]|nr:TIM barrel protein [Terriglobia bacterium]HVC89876.1 TIM barrel protein [Acidobacteriaceae bacterium]
MSIRIATAPVSWGILEVEGWARQQTYAEVLDEMVRAGYVGTELGPYGFLPTDPAMLRAELQKRNLSLIGAFVPLPLKDPAKQQEAMRSALEVAQLLSACSAPFVVLADELNTSRMNVAGSAGKQDGFSQTEWRDAAALISEIATVMKGMGLRSVFHHHAGTYIETPDEVAQLLSLTDPSLLGICLDTGHYLYGGGDPVQFAREHAARIWHLHLKDVHLNVLNEVRRSKIPYLDAIRQGVFCELGKGDVDLVGVIRELEKANFDGWAVFEQDIDTTLPSADPLKSAVGSRNYLHEFASL